MMPQVNDVWLTKHDNLRRQVVSTGPHTTEYRYPPREEIWAAITQWFVEECELVERDGEAVG
jgi:hypothetical protein